MPLCRVCRAVLGWYVLPARVWWLRRVFREGGEDGMLGYGVMGEEKRGGLEVSSAMG